MLQLFLPKELWTPKRKHQTGHPRCFEALKRKKGQISSDSDSEAAAKAKPKAQPKAQAAKAVEAQRFGLGLVGFLFFGLGFLFGVFGLVFCLFWFFGFSSLSTGFLPFGLGFGLGFSTGCIRCFLFFDGGVGDVFFWIFVEWF